MRILHFSDPHAGGPAEGLRAYFDKRIVGVFNYHFRRRFKFRLEKLQKLVEWTLEHPVDAVVCTGDLTSTGQPGEFAIIRELLAPLVESGMPLLYTPGNHDCYVRRPDCVNAVNAMTQYLSRGSYKLADMPFVSSIGDCDFIMLNTSFPSNLLCSWGRVRRADLARVEAFCATPKLRPRILVNHFPLIEPHPWLRLRHRLLRQKALLKLVENGAIDLSLAGHVHHPHLRVDGFGHGECVAGSISANSQAMLIVSEPRDGRFRFEPLTF